MILPFAGMFFGPAFGQSYYEMFEVGNLEGTIHFGSFHNQFHMNNLVTVDLPLGRGALRLGYRNTIYSTLSESYRYADIYKFFCCWCDYRVYSMEQTKAASSEAACVPCLLLMLISFDE